MLALSLVSMSLLAQIKIGGIINDDLGAPLPFATVAIKGTTIGATSDIEGMFALEVPKKGSIVEVTEKQFELARRVLKPIVEEKPKESEFSNGQ